jgi:DNA primase
LARVPQAFIDEVRAAADIVQVVQDVVPLRRVGGTYKGLCPFHSEKTPSFHVNREKGFFHCFGCGVGGDVFKFVELTEKVGFLEAAKLLAQRFGIAIPAHPETSGDGTSDAEREALLKMHEVAAAWFQEQLRGAAAARSRETLGGRGLTAETVARLGIGFAPASRDALKKHLLHHGFALPHIVRGGLVVQRDDGQTVDRFRNRLTIPICRESGSVVAFGGRAMEPDQQPKYLNSPETPVYSKGRTLYGLHLTKNAVRQAGEAVLVEGYFDFAQVLQAGIGPVVATCGTALTTPQAQLLRRFCNKAVLSFDPDAAGQGAAARSCDLLVGEGFQVRVALLPAGDDPDTFVKKHGGTAYTVLLTQAPAWLEYLLDRAAQRHDLERPDGRRGFLQDMLEVAARIPDAATRDQFADRLAHRARITEDVVRAEIRKAAVARRTDVPISRWTGGFTELKPAERDLLAGLVLTPSEAVRALAELEDADLDGLRSGPIIRSIRGGIAGLGSTAPGVPLERLNEEEGRLLAGLAARVPQPAPAADCVRALRVLRLERERADVQREIDRLQELGAEQHAGQIASLWQKKKALLLRLEALES